MSLACQWTLCVSIQISVQHCVICISYVSHIWTKISSLMLDSLHFLYIQSWLKQCVLLQCDQALSCKGLANIAWKTHKVMRYHADCNISLLYSISASASHSRSSAWLWTISSPLADQWGNSRHVFHGRSSCGQCSFQTWSSPSACPQSERRALQRFTQRKTTRELNIFRSVAKLDAGRCAAAPACRFGLDDWSGRHECWPTDGADDAGVACGGGFGVNVQEAHVFEEGVGHGSVELLMLNEGRAQVGLWQSHGAWWYNSGPAEETGEVNTEGTNWTSSSARIQNDSTTACRAWQFGFACPAWLENSLTWGHCSDDCCKACTSDLLIQNPASTRASINNTIPILYCH